MKEKIFGLDRIKLKDIPIEQVDIQKLKRKGFIVIQEDEKSYRILKDSITGEEVGINYIKVSKQQDNTLRINELKVGRGKIPEVNISPYVDYEHLDINLPSQISRQGINDKNINNITDLMEALNLIEWELNRLGFGKIDLMNTELKEIEVNCNIPLEVEFKEYERVIEYLYGLLPKTLKSYNKHRKQGEFTGISVSNTQQEIKFYNKQKQIKDKTGIDIDDKVLRIEYTFKTEDKIKSLFGSNRLESIIENDFNKLQEVMKKLIFKDLTERAYEDIEKQKKHSIRYLKKYKSIGGGGSAIDEYLKNYQSELLDVEIVLEALRETALKNNYARECRKAIASAENIKGIKVFGNINKLNWIYKALGYEEIKIDTTPTIRKEVAKRY